MVISIDKKKKKEKNLGNKHNGLFPLSCSGR